MAPSGGILLLFLFQRKVEVKNGQVLSPKNVSLMTFIRHKIHHPENTHNPNFSDAELDQSIQLMLLVINSSTFQVLI